MLAYIAVKCVYARATAAAVTRVHSHSLRQRCYLHCLLSPFSLFTTICRSQFTVEDCFMQITLHLYKMYAESFLPSIMSIFLVGGL